MKDYSGYTDEALILMMHQGEKEIENYLLEKYKPLVRLKARPLYLVGGDQEDLMQEGMLGLYKAIWEYQPKREASFLTFAGVCISNCMYTAISNAGRKKHQPLNSSVSLAEMTDGRQKYQMRLADSPETILVDCESTKMLLEKINHGLSTMEQKVLELYLSGLDYHQIAEQMVKSAKSIDNALQRIRTKVSKEIQ